MKTEEEYKRLVQRYIKECGKPFVILASPTPWGTMSMYMGPLPETGNMFRTTWSTTEVYTWQERWEAIVKYEKDMKASRKQLRKFKSYRKLEKSSRELRRAMIKEGLIKPKGFFDWLLLLGGKK